MLARQSKLLLCETRFLAVLEDGICEIQGRN